MNIFAKIKNMQAANKEILANVIGSFGIRGLSMILSLFTMPAYIRFFQDQSVLGVWYTLLSIMTWVTYFDLGLGNGLRNKLPKCLVDNDTKSAREYIASTYISVFVLVIIWMIVGNIIISVINWNRLINIESTLIDSHTLTLTVRIVFLGIMLQFITKLITSVLYAVQRSAVVNFLTLLTTVLTLILILMSPSKDVASNLIRMAWINVIAINIPYIFATILIFVKKINNFIPQKSDFSIKKARQILNIGVVLLWLQIVFMVISNTNELLISHFANSADVVSFQAYNKIFNTISSLFTLALTPIWSAITKAQAQKKYSWIKKLYIRLLLLGVVVMGCELAVVTMLQKIVDIWLGTGYVLIESTVAVISSAKILF